MTLGDALQILGGVSPVLLVVMGGVLKRRLDRATAEKTFAEARAQDAQEDKTRQEAAGLVVDYASRLVNEFRVYQAEKDKLNAERLAAAEQRGRSIDERMNRMEEAFSRLRAVLATHGVWDAAALVELRQIHKEYPEPPPLPQSINKIDEP
jgi:hypothetical protein